MLEARVKIFSYHSGISSAVQSLLCTIRLNKKLHLSPNQGILKESFMALGLDQHCTVTQCLDCGSLCNVEKHISMLSFFTQPFGQILQCVLCVSRRGLL